MMRGYQWHNEDTDSRTAHPSVRHTSRETSKVNLDTRPDSLLPLSGRVILRILGGILLFCMLTILFTVAITWSQADWHHTAGGLLIALGMGCVGFVAFSEWLQ